MSVVHLVAILNAVFCVICSLLMFVCKASGDHMVETYSSMGLVTALNMPDHRNGISCPSIFVKAHLFSFLKLN